MSNGPRSNKRRTPTRAPTSPLLYKGGKGSLSRLYDKHLTAKIYEKEDIWRMIFCGRRKQLRLKLLRIEKIEEKLGENIVKIYKNKGKTLIEIHGVRPALG